MNPVNVVLTNRHDTERDLTIKHLFLIVLSAVLLIASSESRASTAEEMLHELKEDLAAQSLSGPFQNSLINRLEAASRVLADSNDENDKAAIGIILSFINYASAIGIDEELILDAGSIIDVINNPNDGELPDLTADAGPNEECDISYPGATLYLVGDISFDEESASGFESYFVFGNSFFNENFANLECVVTYSLTGFRDSSTNIFDLMALRVSGDCPSDLTSALFPSSFDVEYQMQFNSDGTSMVTLFGSGSTVGAGYWNSTRTVYSSDSCIYF